MWPLSSYNDNMRLTIVTLFTLFRVAAAVFILAFLWPHHAWGATLLLVSVAFLTDMFDGMLARRWQVVSWFGKIADPLADKIICLTVLWLLAAHYQAWLLVIAAGLITLYDATTMTLRFTTTRSTKPVAAAHMVAKAKTLILMASLCLFVADLMAGEQTPLFTTGTVLLVTSCGLAVWSLREYVGQVFSKQGTKA